MSFFKKLGTLFRSETQENTPVEVASLNNLKAGNFVEFDFLSQEELSNKTLKVESVLPIKLQSGKSYTFVELTGNLFLNKIDNSNVEVIKKVDDPVQFMEKLSDDIHGILHVDESEIAEENGECILISEEDKFDVIEEIENWMPKEKFYALDHQIESEFNGQNCRFFRAMTSNKKHYVMFLQVDNDVEFYVSTVIPDTYVKNVLG